MVGGITIPGNCGVFINIIYCNFRLQSHQNFKQHYSMFLSYETKKKNNSFEFSLHLHLPVNENIFIKFIYEKFSHIFKKFFCTFVPTIRLKLVEN